MRRRYQSHGRDGDVNDPAFCLLTRRRMMFAHLDRECRSKAVRW
jgi:hypothetical protein